MATATDRSGFRFYSSLIALALAVASCGGDDLLLPSAGQPSKISVFRGQDQTGTVGQPLTDSLVVLVTDPEDRPVSGVGVVFVAAAGLSGATLTPDDTVLTDAKGLAAAHFTLGTTSGRQSVEAHAKPAVPSSVLNTTFNATATPETAKSLVAAGGNGQSGEVATSLADSLAVRAVDRFGNGVAGVEVNWHASGGAVNPTSVVTGPDGQAATERTLGNRPGGYATSAEANGLEGSPISFAATAVAPPSPQLILTTQPSSTARAGVPLDRQPVLQLQDPTGAPLARADVSVIVQVATGGGSLGGKTTVKSDRQGRVSFNDLSVGGGPGVRTLIFAATDFISATSEAVEVRPGPPAVATSSATVPNGIAGSTTEISVQLQDEFGTPVEGEAGNIAVSVGGANSVASLPVTDRGGGSYSASYVPVRSGSDQVAVQVNGTALRGNPFASTVAPGPTDAASTSAVVTGAGSFLVELEVLVTARDAQGNPRGQGGDQVTIQVGRSVRAPTDNGDGTYSDRFIVVTFGAPVSVIITLNGSPIGGSPYTPTPR